MVDIRPDDDVADFVFFWGRLLLLLYKFLNKYRMKKKETNNWKTKNVCAPFFVLFHSSSSGAIVVLFVFSRVAWWSRVRNSAVVW